MDPISIAGLVLTCIQILMAGRPLLGAIWEKLRGMLGARSQSKFETHTFWGCFQTNSVTGSLQYMNQDLLRRSLHNTFLQHPAIARQASQHYLGSSGGHYDDFEDF
jgi:hypothetical protein